MKALILAAGVSRRLYPYTYSLPKCLLEVEGKPIIHYQLEALNELGINEITIIVGYYRETLISNLKKNFPNLNFKFLINHHYFETNTAYSIYVGKAELNSNHILMNADVIYPRELLKKIFYSEYENALAIDIKPCGREEVKVIDGSEHRIVAIGKELIEKNCLGEFIGVAKLSKNFVINFLTSIEQLIKAGGENDYFEAAIQPLLNEFRVNYVDVSEFNCLEIDFIEDLKLARELFKEK